MNVERLQLYDARNTGQVKRKETLGVISFPNYKVYRKKQNKRKEKIYLSLMHKYSYRGAK